MSSMWSRFMVWACLARLTPLPRALWAVLSLGLLGAAHPWEPPFPQADRPCSRLWVVAAHGTARYVQYTYNAQDQLTGLQHFDGTTATGPVQYAVVVSWDATGQIETRQQVGADGRPLERVEVVVRDEAGRQVERYDQRGDRIVEREAWFYDSAGRLLRHRGSERGPDWTYGSDYHYDAEGRPVSHTYGLLPAPFPMRQWQVQYAVDGRTAVVVRRRLPDGRIHSQEFLSWDGAGRLVQRNSPATRSGDERAITTWTYDGTGRITDIAHTNERGEVVERVGFTYSEAGALRQRQDFHGGASTLAHTTTWHYPGELGCNAR